MANSDGKFGTFIRSSNISFIRAKGGELLVDRLPSNGSAHTKDDGSTHTSELEKWKESALFNGIVDLRAPACITISGELVT